MRPAITWTKDRFVVCVSIILAGCGSPVSPGAGGVDTGLGIHHVFVLVEENASYDEALAGMPYLHGLADQYASATQYYGNSHPSIGNYFMLTVGQGVTNDDEYGGTVTEDNLVRRLIGAGKHWKSYAEDLPSVGYTGRTTGRYFRRHNPLSFLSDVASDPAQAQNLVPFSQFGSDLAANSFPDYAFIVPNICNDAHDCPLATADSWLRTNIAPLIDSPGFKSDGLLVMTFDEDERSSSHGGGRVLWVVVGSRVRQAYQSRRLYQHQSTLRLTAQLLGVAAPNLAASAADMGEFFTR